MRLKVNFRADASRDIRDVERDTSRDLRDVERTWNRELGKTEFDFKEFGFALFELFGLMLVMLFEPGPVSAFHVYVAVTRVYCIACDPLTRAASVVKCNSVALVKIEAWKRRTRN